MSRPLLALLALSLSACAGARAAAAGGAVRPAVLEWRIGVDQPGGASGLVETILPETYQGRSVWRVVHRDPDPAQDGPDNAYDMYDVDASTLAPVRSIMARHDFYLGLSFDGDRVRIEKREGDQRSQTEVQVQSPMPEGPGLSVLVASLPLRPGYARSFVIVDRWARDEAHRVQTVELTVAGRRTIQTPMGRCEVLELVIAPRDGSFQIRDWVRAAPPHYPLKMQYVRGDLRLASEVERMVLAGIPETCS